ncbi:cell division protein FtsA [Helicobacter sp. 12S02232-10]|uniref:cell division protein FtsA n=1 Tax=Helicobacter sp. 12S02232-10 TaxID=1476197 RepID=UPI000BA5615C|nr:cell division protein FtsA [Helicobacter sp. 12S02232-10]PAF48237.1 cell division protein FtsA [Helicobacter sp. 12S02232-10]
MSHTILGVDIGSSKICSIIAEVKEGIPQIIGTGTQKSQGIKKGVIVNIELASRAIKNSIADAKRMAGLDNVNKAIVSISGAYTKSVNSSGVVNIPSSEIGIKEIGRVLETALYNASIPSEYEVIHVLPYKFKLDDQDFIEDPMGMNGARLEVFVHIVTVQRTSLENLKKSVRLAGVEIENVVLSAYAASIAVLSDDEKELGVACIDIGGSTCELMIYEGNSMKYNDFLGVGSHHITSDLAMVLNTHIAAAEAVKINYGNLTPAEENPQRIEVPSIGTDDTKHFILLETAQEVIHSRVVETLSILAKSIIRSGLKDQLGAGVVLTGGMINMTGIREIAGAIFQRMPIRIAKPIETIGLFEELKDPASSVAIGLIWYGAGKYTNYEKDSEKNIRYKKDKVNTEPNLPYSQQRSFIGADLTNLKEEVIKNDHKIQKKDIIDDTNNVKNNKVANFFTRLASKLF